MMMRLWPVAAVLLGAACDQATLPVQYTQPEALMEIPEPPPEPEPEPEIEAPPAIAATRPGPGTQMLRPTVTTDLTPVPAHALTILDTEELALTVDVVGAVGEQELIAEFVTPGGSTYRVERRKFVGDLHTASRIKISLPVRGTFIDTYNMHGTWTARVFIGSDEWASRTFQLEQ